MTAILKTSDDKAGTSPPSPTKLILKPEVLDRVGVSYPTLWSWMRQGKFPRARELGGKSAWIESEVNDWIESRPERRLKGDATKASA